MQVAYVEYTGDGNDNRVLNGAGGVPAMAVGFTTSRYSFWRIAVMAADTCQYLGSTLAGITTGIKSLTADGCTLGTNSAVNANGSTYAMLFFCDNGVGDFSCGSYVGDGNDNRDIACVGCVTPGLVFVKAATATQGCWRCAECVGDSSHNYGAADAANMIQGFGASSFQVGTHASANTNGTTYYYVAFGASALLQISKYTGNATDNRDIATLLDAKVVAAKNTAATGGAMFRTSQRGATESTSSMTATTAADNQLQAMDADSFQVGTAASVNTNAIVYHWFGFAAGAVILSARAGAYAVGGALSAARAGAYPVGGAVTSAYAGAYSAGRAVSQAVQSAYGAYRGVTAALASAYAALCHAVDWADVAERIRSQGRLRRDSLETQGRLAPKDIQTQGRLRPDDMEDD